MAVAAKQMEKPVQDQERIARLESDVEHIQTDMSELKADVRKLNEKVDAIKEAVGDLKAQMETRFAKLDMSRALDKVWWLLMSASLLGVMARGFKWL
jgi:uncharacterized protein YlxW (UPF0749 family)